LFCDVHTKLVKEHDTEEVRFALAADAGVNYCWFLVPTEI